MLNTELYTINVTIDEYNFKTVEYFYSFKDAMAARMNYANWYRDNGDVYIRRVGKDGVHVIEEWHIDKDGNIINHWGIGVNKNEICKT